VEDGMTLIARMRIAVLAMICAALAIGPAAAGPQALSQEDAARYGAAFEAAERGDFVDSQLKASEIQDKSLVGHLSFRELMHPTAHQASFEELTAWLSSYADLPVAERVFALAGKRRPAGALAPTPPILLGVDWGQVAAVAQKLAPRPASDRGRQARDAFYAGDLKRALRLAPPAGERWIAGLAAYRMQQYAEAERYFDQVAGDEHEDAWLRAGGAYWAARSAEAQGAATRAETHLRAAAAYPNTFYGMIADRRTRLETAQQSAEQRRGAASQGGLVLASYAAPSTGLSQFINVDPRAHRAAALAQINRPTEASLELRAGLALAKTPVERAQWTALILALNAPLTSAVELAQSAMRQAADLGDYPIPDLEPKSGFTIDKALVYAIVRQESRFNPMAVSPAGAVGLMQLMPEAAARAAGDDKLKLDMSPLFDPAFNLRVGQDYVTWLMERGVGYDILRAVAAYNGGPGTLLKTAQQVGDGDSLLVIECLPALETRNYVEKVMAGYWTYRAKFGEGSPTLDALAHGAKFVDARLDR
jgi:soluble lytic murein transglycosylase-like protein